MKIIIGSARVDEKGTYSGGKDGDQKQTSVPDLKGEVALENFYVHKKGWNIIRFKDNRFALLIADLMVTACSNPNIGYDQGGRYGILKTGVKSTTPVDCDCSSLVRECFKEATGIDPGDFNTGNELTVLNKTGLVVNLPYTDESCLRTGDILVTKTKGHTVIVTMVSGGSKKKSNEEIAKEVRQGKWGNDPIRSQKLKEAGYDPAEIRKLVNAYYKK